MLRRTPWWAWFATSGALLYALYNPWGGGLWGVWAEGAWPLPLRVLATALVLAALGLFVAATWRSIGWFGVGLLAAILGLLLWVAVWFGALDASSAWAPEVLPQIAGAVVLTVGLRWGHVRRAVTGQAIVEDGDG